MTDAIGGYFGLEPRTECSCGFPHQQGVLLNTGRNAFQYILQSIGSISRIYVPYYTCPVVWEHLFFSGVLCFYQIDQNFEIRDEIELKEGEYIVVNNYFGIKDAYIAQLYARYGTHLIVDNAQAFFAPTLRDMKAFYSPRKFFGVPDGGIAYIPCFSISPKVDNQDNSSDRLEHLQLRKMYGAEKGFSVYQKNECKLDDQPIEWMSDYTQEALITIDYASIVARRGENYRLLHQALKEINVLELPDMDSFACPMVYPFMDKSDRKDLRDRLKNERIYTATYWPYVIEHGGELKWEIELAKHVIPLPIDQRYGEEEMKKIIEIIKG